MKKTLGKRKCKNKFSTILLESIDEAFLTLGNQTKSLLYFYLETRFAISKQDIPARIGDFSEAIEQIFGSGAQNLEILIMKFLNEKANCAFKWVGPKWLVPELTFTKYVKLLELWCEDKEKIHELEVTMDFGEQQRQQVK